MATIRRLALVRHGRSAHVHVGWIDAAGFRAWRAAYEAAGIVAGERPPASLHALLERADLVAASDAPRALSSARLLAPGREVVVSPLLRELDLEAPSLGALRLPLAAWAVAVGGQMLVTRLRGDQPPPAEDARIGAAAAWLHQLALESQQVVAVTHHSFRGQLVRRLMPYGWRPEPGPRSSAHWSAWLLARADPSAADRGPGG